jgi:NAD-dependent dihydropyrimidine dehydrogenase PreA subunit
LKDYRLEARNMVKKEFSAGDITIIIDYEKCTGAGECVTVCPVDIFSLENEKAVCKNVDECIECCACVSSCPNDAIEHSSC